MEFSILDITENEKLILLNVTRAMCSSTVRNSWMTSLEDILVYIWYVLTYLKIIYKR